MQDKYVHIAIWSDKPKHLGNISSFAFRAPENIIRAECGKEMDIWAIGWESLFQPQDIPGLTPDESSLLLQFAVTGETLSKDVIDQSRVRDKFFNPEGLKSKATLLNQAQTFTLSMKERLTKRCGGDLTERQINAASRSTRDFLRLNSCDRPTANKLCAAYDGELFKTYKKSTGYLSGNGVLLFDIVKPLKRCGLGAGNDQIKLTRISHQFYYVTPVGYLEETQIPEWRKAYMSDRQEMDISEASTHSRYIYGAIESRSLSGSQLRPALNERSSVQIQRQNTARGKHSSNFHQDRALTLETLYSSLDHTESTFFLFLDNELGKVDGFYNEREDSAMSRLSDLKKQLDELAEHQKVFYEAGGPGIDTWRLSRVVGDALGVPKLPRLHQIENSDNNFSRNSQPFGKSLSPPRQFDPMEYQHAKHRMKKALREFYRSAELLNDYRVYGAVERCRFAKSKRMEDTLREIENIFAARFGTLVKMSIESCFLTSLSYSEKGDRKKALKKLKSAFQHRSHYFSVFRTGAYIGLGFPALVLGLYNSISPTTWPLIWLVFALVLLVNPFPIFSRSSRYWFIKHLGKLVAPGWGPVEFADFWLGDQFCSLAFSLAHIFTVGCAYSHSWEDVFFNCGSTTHWATLALLTSPYVSRMVQSVRRYYDSRLPAHLINGGKYFSSIIMYVTYYVWRFKGSHRDATFAIWCIFATIASTYTSSWIYLDHLYTKQWIEFPDRLENEQVGNTDQYRATREVPLPYSSTYQQDERDNDDSDGERSNSISTAARSLSGMSLRMRLFESRTSDHTRQNERNE
ncbi:hypothetical protein Clacol_009286 [Clathrus columnatus]|uniref:SPX domain-containing protein n=1 Tax=Clathrus columnatus TaxID=1419009 RepID=A0AAV5AQP4_9AGAM|nr:hypothetical protein Clacol_009286 [Clathrus columnatus]